VSSVTSTVPTTKSPAVIDQDVETAELPGNVRDQLFGLGRITLVGLEGCGADAPGFEFAHHRLGQFGGADIADGDVGSLVGQGFCRGRADAARTTRDEGNLASESLGH
jgi:hypothetical protein